MVWRRLNDHGKNWRHVYKSLVVLEYLVKNGSERVVRQCQDNLFSIQTLKDFQFLDKDGKDQGSNGEGGEGTAGDVSDHCHGTPLSDQQGDRTNIAHAECTCTRVLTCGLSCVYARVSSLAVREKAKFLVALLKDQERLKEERDRAKQARSRLLQSHSGVGVSGDFGRTRT